MERACTSWGSYKGIQNDVFEVHVLVKVPMHETLIDCEMNIVRGCGRVLRVWNFQCIALFRSSSIAHLNWLSEQVGRTVSGVTRTQ